MSGDEPNPFDRVVESWEGVIADMEGIATEYREAEWDVLELHPGNVATLGVEGGDGDRFGLEALVPDPEFDRLESWIESGTEFGSYEVFRTTDSGIVFLLVVLTDEATERAVCVPAYYESSKLNHLRDRAESEGVFFTYVRRLRRDRVITFTQDDPELFFPDESGEGD